MHEESRRRVEEVLSRLTLAITEDAVRTLMRQGEDVGGGVNALRLVKHLLGDPLLEDAEAAWAYDCLKPVFRTIFARIPSLYYFEGG